MRSEAVMMLRNYFGHPAFRPSQEEAVKALLGGRDLLAVMPTGAGKSVCYQLPSLMMEGITLVISPLISLMKDQVTALLQNGISAAYINSSLTSAEYYEVLRNASAGAYKLLYVTPERLQNPGFLQMCRGISISMVTVDEAHCISQWGQDFRPSYLKIADFVDQIPRRPVVSAFTATATERVRRDIASMLRLKKPHRIVTSFDRENLYFEVQHPIDKEGALLKILRQRAGSCGIIYCLTRKEVEKVCAFLQERGFSAARYHGGLSDQERHQSQEDFSNDRVEVIVATNAFGMGIDKSNVHFVVHYQMPLSLENYYQEAGRAGRDGSASDCILLYHEKDLTTAQFLIEQSDLHSEPETDKRTAELLKKARLRRLHLMKSYCTGTGCLRQFLLAYFGQRMERSCGCCSSCLSDYEEADVTIDAQKFLSCIVRVEQAGYLPTRSLVYDILWGKRTQTIADLKLDGLSTFGLMKKVPSLELDRLTHRLEECQMMDIFNEDCPTFVRLDRSNGVLFGRQRLTMRRPKQVHPLRPAPKPGVDPVKYQRLVELRKRLANRAGIPPYLLFSDVVLREICRRNPHNRKEFQSIPGITPAKADQYWKDFVALGLQSEQKT